MPAANVAIMFLCTCTLAWHAIASKTRFRTIGRTPPRMKAIGASFAIGAVVNVVEIAGSEIDLREAMFALAIYGFSLALFGWACTANRDRPLTVAFSADVPVHLVTTGPYRFFRHPFYTAYCLTWLAGFVATHSWFALALAAVMLVQYMQAARVEEAKFAASPMAARYREYRARTLLHRMPVLAVLSRL